MTAVSKTITWVADGIGYRVLADGRTKSYCIDYFDAAGKRVRTFKDPESGGPMRSKDDAKTARARVTVRKATGTQIVKTNVKLKEFSEEWLGRQFSAGISTMTGWRSSLRLHILPVLGRVEVARINKMHIRDLILAKRKAGLSESTIANIVQPLRMILDEAVSQNILSVNPWAGVAKKERPKPSTTRKKRRILTMDEIDRLLAGASVLGERMRALVCVFVYAGLRKSEALGLVWSNVDFDAGVLHVERQLARREDDRVGLKTDASARTIPLSRELRASLAAWKMRSGHSHPGDFVFATGTGRPLTQRNCYRMVTNLALTVGINDAPPEGLLDAEAWTAPRPQMDVHSLRHVFASAMIRATKGDPERVARLTGHGDTGVLLKIYSHEFDSARGGNTVADEAALIDQAFGG